MQELIADTSLAEMLNDSSIDRVMAIDHNKKIISWNKTSEIITGLLRTDLIGRDLLEALPELNDDEKFLSAIDAALKGLKSFLPADRQYAHRQLYEMHFIPLSGAGKQIIGVMTIMHDVSHRIKAEQQLHQLNQQLEKKYRELELASSELSTFTIITSTNIKEPVRHIYTGLEFLVKSEGRNLSDAGKASLRRMQSSLNRMNLLLNDILTFSQIGNPEARPGVVDTKACLAAAMEKLQQKIYESNASIEIKGDWPQITGYQYLLDLLFFHLLDNAIKFHQAGSVPKVTVEVTPSLHNKASMPGHHDKEFVCLRVTDNGIGFLQADTTRIFSLFEKLHGNEYRGSGMGLAIARKIMELHDGYIITESTPGEGSVFQCYFPVNPATG